MNANYRQATFESNGVRYYVSGYFNTGNAYCTIDCGKMNFGSMDANGIFDFSDLPIGALRTINAHFKE